MIGRVYLERGVPVVIEIRQWRGGGPRNVQILRPDGSRVVRLFPGLRKPPPGSQAARPGPPAP